ncbi:MAG: hypothetical protein L0Y72_12335 [Gemmataceae bacterium]|nr:hypothetical protein [Gemmataceae bacterium]
MAKEGLKGVAAFIGLQFGWKSIGKVLNCQIFGAKVGLNFFMEKVEAVIKFSAKADVSTSVPVYLGRKPLQLWKWQTEEKTLDFTITISHPIVPAIPPCWGPDLERHLDSLFNAVKIQIEDLGKLIQQQLQDNKTTVILPKEPKRH